MLLVHDIWMYAMWLPYFICDYVPSLRKYKIQKKLVLALGVLNLLVDSQENTFENKLHCWRAIMKLRL